VRYAILPVLFWSV